MLFFLNNTVTSHMLTEESHSWFFELDSAPDTDMRSEFARWFQPHSYGENRNLEIQGHVACSMGRRCARPGNRCW
jgi:hypothetical protein